MTRLFLRFYLGVIVILIAAWLIQTSVFRKSTIEENTSVVEDILSSSARLARDRIVSAGEEEFLETMKYLESRFDYPIRVVQRQDRSMDRLEIERLDRGDSILYHDRIETAIPGSSWLVELGPLPQFDQPSQTELSFALGGVFSLAAIGIAILLRPVMLQLRGVEKAALAIADGDLSARIDHGRFRHSAALAGAFNEMADRVETLLRSQKELLQTVSHELRTPLARIRFATELIESTDDVQERKLRLAAIDDATDQLDELVGELLTYVRLDAERIDTNEESTDAVPVAVNDLVSDQIELHSPLYPAINFSSDLLCRSPVVLGHQPEIARAVGNLISNAGKYAKSIVVVSVTEFDDRVVLAVDDDGPGIAETDRKSIFEPFKRLTAPDGRELNRTGTGLGLALVKRIAERSGGTVTVTDSDLGGAKFVLSLPIAEGDRLS